MAMLLINAMMAGLFVGCLASNCMHKGREGVAVASTSMNVSMSATENFASIKTKLPLTAPPSKLVDLWNAPANPVSVAFGAYMAAHVGSKMLQVGLSGRGLHVLVNPLNVLVTPLLHTINYYP